MFAIDASLWDEPTTGIGLYTHRLAAALGERGAAVRRVGARLSGENPRGGLNRSLYAIAKLPEVLRGIPEPLFHAVCNFNLPLTRLPGKAYVLTVHDLIPEVLPETVSIPFRLQFKWWLQRSLSLADEIICVSAHTRADLLARHQVDPAKVSVVHLGIDHVDAVPAPDAAELAYLLALGLPESFVLYAGALDARKNVGLVLEACAELRARGAPPTLVLAGQQWFGSGSIERRIAELRSDGLDIRPLGYQSAPVLYELMRRAAVFVFPSRYEGFGLPPLEAMRLGTPTIVSNAGSLPEICGDGAIQVDPGDSEALANRIGALLADRSQRESWRRRGLERARTFSWQKTAAATLDVYARALAAARAR